MPTKSIVVCFVLTMAVLSPVVVAAQQATGTIAGTVVDSSKAVMPGVTVSIASPGVIGGNQMTVTDERGAYQFVRLVPGTYTVRAELQGFRPAVRAGLVVNADVTVRNDFTIEIGTVEETITVSGAAPLLDTATVHNQTVMDRKTMDAIPVGNSLWSVGALVPAVQQSSIDVGGTSSFSVAIQKVHGAGRTEGRYLVDGMDVGSARNPGQVIVYWDTSMFEEINYQTGQAPAESPAGGVVMNMVTKTGTNTFRFIGDASGSVDDLMSNNISAKQRADLLAAVPPLVLQVNPAIEPTNAVPWIYNVSANFSGPIVSDRLWFVASAGKQALEQYVTGSYNADGTVAIDDNELNNLSGKLSWQVSPGNMLHGLVSRNQKWRFHNRSFPGATFIEDRATPVQDTPMYVTQLKWTSMLSTKLMVDASGSVMKGPFLRYAQPEVQQGDLPRLDLVTRVGSGASPFFYNNQPYYHRGFYSSLSYFSAGHNLKVGYQQRRQTVGEEAQGTSHYPSGLLARYRSGVPDSVIVYNYPFNVRTVIDHHSLYVQDKWTPTNRLTFSLGLRLDRSKGYVPERCQPASLFLTEMCFDRIDDVPDWLDLSPRFGLIYDVFGDGKTAVKIAANRYLHGAGGDYPQRVNPVKAAQDTRPWVDTNGDLIPQLNELGVGTGFNLGTTNRYDSEVKNPSSTELSAELERQLGSSMAVSIGYFYRALRRDGGVQNLLVPRESYIPLDVVERVSGRAVTVYNQAPQTRGLFDMVYDNYPERDQTFHGVDLLFNKRMSNRWMMMGGLSIGRHRGETYTDVDDLNNPNFTFRDGTVDTDVPVSFKVSGAYTAPWNIQLSGSYEHRTGFPEAPTVVVTSQTVALTQVSQTLRVEPLGYTRLPSNNVVNVRFARNITFARGGRVTPALDIFNLTNSNAEQARSTQLGPTFGRVSEILRPRMLKFGVQWSF